MFVITNQAGIGRGKYTEEQFMALTKWMLGEFSSRGCKIDAVEYCPFHPTHGIGIYKQNSVCRKPNPGMITKLAKKYTQNLSNSVLIGDKKTDIEAGISAGIQTNVLLSKCPINLECVWMCNLHEAQGLFNEKIYG